MNAKVLDAKVVTNEHKKVTSDLHNYYARVYLLSSINTRSDAVVDETGDRISTYWYMRNISKMIRHVKRRSLHREQRLTGRIAQCLVIAATL